MEHDEPGGNVVQSVVSLNSDAFVPVIIIELTERSEVPLFLTVTAFEGELFPAGMFPKFTDLGATEITGSACADWRKNDIKNKKLTTTVAVKVIFFILSPFEGVQYFYCL